MSTIYFPSTWTWDQIGDWLEAREADGFWLNGGLVADITNNQSVWVME